MRRIPGHAVKLVNSRCNYNYSISYEGNTQNVLVCNNI